MNEALAKTFAIILATYILFLFPTYQIAKKEEDLAYINTAQHVTNFVDNVRMKGFITPEMYKDFEVGLHLGVDALYDIEMEHEQKKYVPVYDDPSDISTYQDRYEVHYETFAMAQIKKVLFDTSIPEEDRIYKLQNGDTFQVVVENKTRFKSTMLLNFMTGGIAGNDGVIYYPYGGMVLNEDWTDR